VGLVCLRLPARQRPHRGAGCSTTAQRGLEAGREAR